MLPQRNQTCTFSLFSFSLLWLARLTLILARRHAKACGCYGTRREESSRTSSTSSSDSTSRCHEASRGEIGEEGSTTEEVGQDQRETRGQGEIGEEGILCRAREEGEGEGE